ncbi:MAG: alginate lyase family protein [Anaerolineae bacterium]|nr:alginate lyase family protein [Anaerolineae bacterium]
MGNSVRRFWLRCQRFVGHGPTYALTYARWRSRRLAERIWQRFSPPAWPLPPALPIPGLESLPSPVEMGPLLAAYLTQRERPRFHFSPSEAAAIAHKVLPDQQRRTVEAAQALLHGEHTYRSITVVFQDLPDWRHTPQGSADWRWDLNRHFWLLTLARARHYTGDEAFARHAALLLQHWMEHNPPDVRNPAWRPFEVGVRLGVWTWAAFLLAQAPPFVQEGLGCLWQGLRAQARYLRRHLERHVVNNHLLLEAKSLAMVGLLFPELPEAAIWLEEGLETLWAQVRRQFHPDGVHAEQATQYHALCTGDLWEMIRLLEYNGVSVPADVRSRWEAAVHFQAAIVRPDGSIPLFGDSARHDPHRRFDARWALPETRPTGEPDEETRWLLGVNLLPKERGIAPESETFPEGGYVVMQDPNHHLVLDCGPFGDPVVPSHAHADALSFELWACGQTLLTDSGGYTYHAPPEWRAYFRGTRAHNTVVVDGEDQSVLLGRREVARPAQAWLKRWSSTPYADWAVAEHDGYTRLPDPVLHQRQILFLGKGEDPDEAYWLLVDTFKGASAHRLNWHFHLPPGARWSWGPERRSLWTRAEGAGLAILPGDLADLQAQVVEGQLSPPLGWVSLESGQKDPAPTLVLIYEGDLPVHLPVLLMPYRSDALERLVWQTQVLGGKELVVNLTTPRFYDRLVLTLEGEIALLRLPPLTARARGVWMRNSPGRPPRALVWEPRAIYSGDQLVWVGEAPWILLLRRGGRWEVDGVEAGELSSEEVTQEEAICMSSI